MAVHIGGDFSQRRGGAREAYYRQDETVSHLFCSQLKQSSV
jgi:hypothetical protein